MMHRQMQQEDPETEILEAFRMTDKQKKGYIQASELRTKLTTLGEKLTNKEGKLHRRFPPEYVDRNWSEWLALPHQAQSCLTDPSAPHITAII